MNYLLLVNPFNRRPKMPIEIADVKRCWQSYLQFIASSRCEDEAKTVDHVGHKVLGLTDANGFHENQVVT